MDGKRVAFARRDVAGVRDNGQCVLVPKGSVLYDAWEVSRRVVEGVFLMDDDGQLARVRVVRSAVTMYDDPLAAIKAAKEVSDGLDDRYV